ncbi:MAG: hypothetical protein ACKVQV_12590 [Bacteroidia bacterium]
MDSENQKGFIGTIIFHGLLFLTMFLMSFAGNSGGGVNGTGEALGGVEVSLGEPDLGGPDSEAGYSPETVEATATETPVENETLTEDDAEAPILPSKEAETKPKTAVVSAPKITPPVYKPTKPSPVVERRPDSKGLFSKKGGQTGDGSKPGNEGRNDGSVFGDKDGSNGNGTGPGDGDGNGKPGDGDGDGPSNGPGSGTGVKFDLSGFKRNNEFNIVSNRAGSGTVIIELCVFKDGRLKSARYVLGGTITEKYFIDLALKAVKENTYSPIGSATTDKCGKVKFTFKAR